MILKTAVQLAHQLLERCLEPGAIAVDATAGNGHDTRKLAELVGENGQVYAFDIQKQAIESTSKRLKEAGLENRVTLIHDSHHHAPKHLQNQAIHLALFNLGYLPGGDKSIVTQCETTKQAAKQLLEFLKPEGLLILVLYPGHEEGRLEAGVLEDWAQGLDQKQYTVQRIEMINQVGHPPYVIAIEKKA